MYKEWDGKEFGYYNALYKSMVWPHLEYCVEYWALNLKKTICKIRSFRETLIKQLRHFRFVNKTMEVHMFKCSSHWYNSLDMAPSCERGKKLQAASTWERGTGKPPLAPSREQAGEKPWGWLGPLQTSPPFNLGEQRTGKDFLDQQVQSPAILYHANENEFKLRLGENQTS